jgi:hypothetical protein
MIRQMSLLQEMEGFTWHEPTMPSQGGIEICHIVSSITGITVHSDIYAARHIEIYVSKEWAEYCWDIQEMETDLP